MTKEKNVRVQIAVGNRLIGEVILESPHDADKLWSDWCKLRYRRGEEMGCAGYSKVEDDWSIIHK